MSDKLLTIRDLENRGVGDRITQYRARLAGKLGFYKIGSSVKYAEHHVQEYLASHEKPMKERKARQAT